MFRVKFTLREYVETFIHSCRTEKFFLVNVILVVLMILTWIALSFIFYQRFLKCQE
jgi:hypothetical protein